MSGRQEKEISNTSTSSSKKLDRGQKKILRQFMTKDFLLKITSNFQVNNYSTQVTFPSIGVRRAAISPALWYPK